MRKVNEDFERARCEATYKLATAIMGAISQMPGNPTIGEPQDIYQEWLEEEDGDIAITRLVNLII